VLAVVGIIVLLIGLIFPAAQLLRQSAKRRLAASQAVGIAQAIKEYHLTYGKWPGQDQGVTDRVYLANCAPLLLELTNNPRGTLFLGHLDSIVANECFIDPWNRSYIVGVDDNGDETIALACPGPTTNTITVHDTVAVMSLGPRPSSQDKQVYSWKP
jgi:type II secretory pathway pseudopilin PulG